MKESGSPKILFESLDLIPIHPILWTGLHGEGPGRPIEYQPEWDLRALMLRQLLQIPYVKDLVKRLRRDFTHSDTGKPQHFTTKRKTSSMS